MKVLGLILVAALLFSGCATFKRSEYIDTDPGGGLAYGKYSDSSEGPTGSFAIAGAGASWGGGGSGGLGGGAISIKTGPPQSSSYNFARSVAMINYSKKLKSIKYDGFGRIIEYEFDSQPLAGAKGTPVSKSSLPSSFGHQPIE
jgi:hypothetical protein